MPVTSLNNVKNITFGNDISKSDRIQRIMHRYENGDSIYDIAKTYNMSTQDVLQVIKLQPDHDEIERKHNSGLNLANTESLFGFTKEQAQAIVELYKSGLFVNQISKQLGMGAPRRFSMLLSSVDNPAEVQLEHYCNSHSIELPQEQRQQILDLFALGVTKKLICNKFNIPLTVLNFLIDSTEDPEKLKEEHCAKVGLPLVDYKTQKSIINDFRNGMTSIELAAKYNISLHFISNILKQQYEG